MFPRNPGARSLSRTIVKTSIVLAGLLALSSTASAQQRVVIGTPGSLGDASLAVYVAIDRGFYKEAGIDAEVVDFKGGAPGIQALIGNGVQYVIAAPEHVVRLRTRGVDGVVAFALDTRHTYALITPEKSSIKAFKDLKGRKVGITSPGSLTENLVKLEALHSGLNPATDIELVGAGVGIAQKSAIDNGRVDAGMFGNLDVLQFAEPGKYRIVYDWRTQSVPSLALLSREKWIKDNPAIAKGIVQATLKAQKLILSDKALAAQALSKLYPNFSKDTVAKVIDSLSYRLSPDGTYTQEQFDHLQNDLIELDPSLKRADFKVAVPGTYLK